MTSYDKNLIDAVHEKNPKKAEKALKAGASPNTIVPPELYQGWEGLPLLHYAVLQDAKNLVLMLVNKGADVNATDRHGRTPLHYIKDANMIKFFLNKGASPYILDRNGFSPVFHAANSNRSAALAIFKEMGLDLNRVDGSGNTLLHLALAIGYSKVISWLLQNSIDVKVKNQWNRTPKDVASDLGYSSKLLQFLNGVPWKGPQNPGLCTSNSADLVAAVHFKNESEVKRLLDSGVSPNVVVPPEFFQAELGQTVLHYAVKKHAIQVVYSLVNKGADLQATDKNGRTPLHYAVIFKDTDAIKFFIKKGVSPNDLDTQGKSPVCYAINRDYVDALEALCKNEEVNLSRRDDFGNTYLHIALANGNRNVIKWLSEKSLDVEVKNQWGRTPKDVAQDLGYKPVLLKVLNGSQKMKHWNLTWSLHAALLVAIRTKKVELVEKALDSGISPNVAVPPELSPDSEGQNVLHYAIQQQATEAAELLVSRGADIRATDKKGRTPLHYAVMYSSHPMVELLLEKQASPFELDAEGLNTVYYAVCGNNTLALDIFRKRGINLIDQKDSSGKTYLQLAQNMKQMDVVQWLKKNHVGVEKKDCMECAPQDIVWDFNCNQELKICNGSKEKRLHSSSSDIRKADKRLYDALLRNKVEDVIKAVKEGASLEMTDPEMFGNITPVHYAAHHCSKMMVEALIKGGGCLESRDERGEVPLHSAVRGGKHDTVEYLLSQGADAHALNKEGITPVTLAVIVGSVRILKIFKKNKINVNTKDRNGSTYLHHAWAHEQGLKTVCWLLENKVCVTERNHFGRTAEDVAKDMGYDMHIVKLLNSNKKKGSVPVLKTPVYLKLLDAVVQDMAEEVSKALQEGASPTVLVPPERSGCLGVTVLLYAATHGSKHAVEALVKGGIDLNAKDAQGKAPLHLAVQQEKPKALECLLSQGADPHVLNRQGMSPMILAVQGGIVPILEVFRANGVDLNTTDKYGSTYLHHALAYGQNAETICWLLEKNVCRDKVNHFSRTAKDVAKDVGYNSHFIEFLDSSVKMDSVPDIRIPVLVKLFSAIQRNEAIEVVKVLRKGASLIAPVPPELSGTQDTTTSLHFAAHWCSKQVVKELVKGGADVEGKDGSGEVPLHKAVRGRNVDTVAYLLKQGADPHAVNLEGVTPIILAVKEGSIPVLEIFMKQGIDLMVKDSSGNTCLHHAVAQKENKEMIQWLLKNKVSVDERNHSGRTAEDIAKEVGLESCILDLVSCA